MAYGETASGAPSNANSAAQYKTNGGYQSGWHVVADPKWTKIDGAITYPPGTISLPFYLVMDGNMQLRYLGSSDGMVASHVDSILAGEPFDPSSIPAGMTCKDNCDSDQPAPAGCYCDSACMQYGDCCPDACDLCGHCG